jgi:TonB-linked SusC/RagA family outer membrane protein
MNVRQTFLCSLLLMPGVGAGVTTISAALPNVVQQQQKGIKASGTVVDNENNPLIGATVTVKGTKTIAITDMDGHFYIDVPNKNSVLVFNYLGFKPQEVKVGSDINFNIQLKEDAVSADEVVVVGYGNQKKLSVIGSIQTLDPGNLQMGSSRSMSNNLAGQLAGVIAYQPSGEPGYDNSQFWIRGISTFGAGGSSPLVLVDGVERSLNDIDPAEIESFSVLKDASASAMYGVRGANGVIIINTKRGSVAKPSIDFRFEQAITKPTKLPEFIGAAEYMTLLNNLCSDPSKRMFTKDQIMKTYTGYDKDLYPDVDWIDAITKDYATSTRGNMTVSGGTNILRYSLTASVYHETGIMETDDTLPYDTGSKLTRFNMRANVDLDLTKTTLLRFNVGGYLQNLRKAKSSTDNVFTHAFETPPFVHPAIYSDGTIPKAGANRANPWAENTQQGYYRGTRSKLESLFQLEQNLKMITPGLKFKATFAFDTYNENFVTRGKDPTYYGVAKSRGDEGELIHSVLSYGSEFLDHSSNANYGNNSTYLEFSLGYNHTFAKKHAVDALFLYNQRSYDWGDIQPKRSQGIAGRLSYTFDRRYVGEFNFGYNGSENFAKGHRFGFFPSLALGWIISEEKFMRNCADWLTLLKLKGSIGKVGNDDIGGRRFAYLTTINTGASGYHFGYAGDYWRGGYSEGEVGVNNLTWETSTKTNVGIELGLWNEFNLQFDYFYEHRTNIFMQRKTIPTQAGFLSNPYANYGVVDNSGVDGTVTWNHKFGKDLRVALRANFTYAKNEVKEYDEPESVKGTYRSLTGRSIGTLWGLQAERLYTDDDFENGKLKAGIPTPNIGSVVRPGDIKYRDMNDDGVVDAKDEGYIGGTTTPRIVYGFGGNVEYKNFDFSFFFQGTGQSYRIIGGTQYFIPGSGQGVMGNVYANYKDCWTEENPSQDVFWPRLSESTNPNNNYASTWWKKDMSFLRLKSIELGYTLPRSITKAICSNNIRFFVSGNNLFYISKFKLWDPELDTADGLKYPSMRSVMFGFQLNF